MILTKDERKQVYQDWLNSETLTDEDGLIQLAETALLEKLRGGVELPEALGDGFTALVTVGDTPSLMEKKRICVCPIAVCSLESAIQYGAAQRLAGQQWLPIESAPKDGTEIMLYSLGDVGVCYWRDDDVMTGWTWGLCKAFGLPTHWQPLPPPPASPQEQT